MRNKFSKQKMTTIDIWNIILRFINLGSVTWSDDERSHSQTNNSNNKYELSLVHDNSSY